MNPDIQEVKDKLDEMIVILKQQTKLLKDRTKVKPIRKKRVKKDAKRTR
tara:strand:+ start:547 stop:693 length:147 start_codon:yes stop_codon:yes gene_type:complete